MIEALTYKDMLDHILGNDLVEDTIGILITRPLLATGKDIVGELEYYHHLTGHSINFYLPGYGAYWNTEEYPDMKVVTQIDRVEWSFSSKAFVEFINALEEVSRWKYSGESELLLIPYHDGKLDFSSVAVFCLDAMLKDEAISSVSRFITELSRSVRKNNDVKSIATKGGSKCVAKAIGQEMIDTFLRNISKALKRGRHYICKDFSGY